MSTVKGLSVMLILTVEQYVCIYVHVLLHLYVYSLPGLNKHLTVSRYMYLHTH